MELSSLFLIAAGLVCLNTIALVLVIIIQQIQLRRYERFRLESADVLTNLTHNIVDINARLTAAGYPPGRILPLGPIWKPPS